MTGGGLEVADGASVEPATEAMGRPEDIVDPEQSNTKLVDARVLPDLGSRL